MQRLIVTVSVTVLCLPALALASLVIAVNLIADSIEAVYAS